MFSSGHLTSGHVTDVIFSKKAILRPILRNFRLRMGIAYFRTCPLPLTSLPVTWLMSLPVKRPYYGGYCATGSEHTSGHGLFRSRHFWSRDWRHFRWKGHATADIAQLPVAHAQSILSDMPSSAHVTSGHVIDLTSGERALLRRIMRNFRLRMGRTYFWTWPLPVTSLPITWLTSFPMKMPYCGVYWATSVAHGQNILPDMASSDHVTDVISGEKAILRRILRNFRLRIRRTYFRTWPLPDTSLPVTWLTSFPLKRPYYDGYCATGSEHTPGHGLFRSRHIWSRDLRLFRWKGHATADIAQLPVVHAQNMLSDMASFAHVTSGHVTDVISSEKAILRGYCATSSCACAENTSGHGLFRSCHFRSHDWCHVRCKGPTTADNAQLSVAHGQNILPDMAFSGHVTSGRMTDVIFGEKAILRRILRNFRLRMRRAYVRIWPLPVTSLPVTWLTSFLV